MFRRRRLPAQMVASFAAFRAVLDELEPAKAALADVMPTTRMPGRPLAEALREFEAGVERARPLMPAWRVTEIEPQWAACEEGLAEAARRARRFREEAPDVGGFEGLIWAVEQLLAPLDAFAAAEDRFRALGAR